MTLLGLPLKELRITQRFGENPKTYQQFGLKGHNGVDYGCPIGTPVLAVDDATVFMIGDQFEKGFGLYIKLKTHEGFECTYAHLSGVMVKERETVKRGAVIGYTGNSGFSTGPHLHFGLRMFDSKGNILNYSNGYKGAINPLLHMEDHATTVSITPGVPPENPEREAAKMFMEETKIMSNTNGDVPMLRRDVALVAYRICQWVKKKLNT